MAEQPEIPSSIQGVGSTEARKPAENQENTKEKLFDNPDAKELYALLLGNLPDQGDANVIDLPKGKMFVLDKDSGKPVAWNSDIKSGDLTFLVKPDHPVTSREFVGWLPYEASLKDHSVISEYVIVRKNGEDYSLQIPEGDMDNRWYFEDLFEGKKVAPPKDVWSVRKTPYYPQEKDLVKAVGRSVLIAVNELPDWFVKRTEDIKTFVESTNKMLSTFVSDGLLKPKMGERQLNTKGPDPLLRNVFSASSPEDLRVLIDLGVEPLSNVLGSAAIDSLSGLGSSLESDFYVATRDEQETKSIPINNGKALLEISFGGILGNQTSEADIDVPAGDLDIPYHLNSLRMYEILPDGSNSPLFIDFGISKDTKFANREEYLKFLADRERIDSLQVTHFIVEDSRKITQAPKTN